MRLFFVFTRSLAVFLVNAGVVLYARQKHKKGAGAPNIQGTNNVSYRVLAHP